MEDKIKKIFDTIVGEMLIPIILKDKDIVKFARQNGFDKKEQIMGVTCWLAGATMVAAFQKQKDEVSVGLVKLGKQLVDESRTELSKEYDNIDEILVQVLADNVQEWSQQVGEALQNYGKNQGSASSTTSYKKVTKKTTKSNDSSGNKSPAEQLTNMTLGLLGDVVAREEDVDELVEKYEEYPRANILTFICSHVLLKLYKELKVKLKEMPAADILNDYIDEMISIVDRLSTAMENDARKSLDNYKAFLKDFKELLEDHYDEFAKKLTKKTDKVMKEYREANQ